MLKMDLGRKKRCFRDSLCCYFRGIRASYLVFSDLVLVSMNNDAGLLVILLNKGL